MASSISRDMPDDNGKNLPANSKTELPFYLTPPAACPYLGGRTEQRLLTFIEKEQAGLTPSLLAAGFRRSQNMFYRPHCPACTACLSVRLPVADFVPDKGFRRILRRNADLRTDIRIATCDENLYRLFHNYQMARHADSEMAAMTIDDLAALIEDHPGTARLMHCTKGEQTLGVMLLDETTHATSAVYSFFDPAENRRSLGTWMILKLIEYTQVSGREFMYLGYLIRQSPKMAYKERFQPLQILIKNEWIDFKNINI